MGLLVMAQGVPLRPLPLLRRSLVQRGGDVFPLCPEALLPMLLLGCVWGVNLPSVISVERRYG